MAEMSPRDDPEGSVRHSAARFATTHWSLVLAAGRKSSPDSQQALAALCETYWYPLYAYIRRRGHGAHEAQDLTQEFFAALLEMDSFRAADRQRGRFRSFLLASLNHFLAKQWRKAAAQKRGGGRRVLSIDVESGESRYRLEPSHDLTPEKIYERRWALTLLERALARLREEFDSSGRAVLFEHLKPFVGGDRSTVPYRQIAADAGMAQGAVKVAVHRLRRRCRELLREEIAQTVADPKEIDDELRDLFAAVGAV